MTPTFGHYRGGGNGRSWQAAARIQEGGTSPMPKSTLADDRSCVSSRTRSTMSTGRTSRSPRRSCRASWALTPRPWALCSAGSSGPTRSCRCRSAGSPTGSGRASRSPLAVVWWSVFTALTAVARGIATLLGCRLLLGVGEAGAYPSMAKVAANWFPKSERGLGCQHLR